MNERRQLANLFEPLIVCVIFSAMYAVGGSQDFWGGQKWIRRFLAPFLFSFWAFYRSLDWRYLFQMPFMMGALCLPYGAEDMWEKIVKRGIFGIANATAFSITNFFEERWALVILQVILVTSTSIILGVYNPVENAIVEQAIIGWTIICIPAFSVHRWRPKYRV